MDSSYAANLTASPGGLKGGATPIRTTYSRFSIVATTGDSCVLPNAAGGTPIHRQKRFSEQHERICEPHTEPVGRAG
jgi:hypothetical protein